MQLAYRIIFKLQRLIWRQQVMALKKRFKYCGPNVMLDHSCHIIVPEQMEIGECSSISAHTTIFATFGVRIGRYCLISSNCGISSYNHITDSDNRYRDRHLDVLYSKPVIIGDNVWIGMNACILPGVTIGDNAIIGSGSVVTRNVPPNEIWAGNPARFIKKITVAKHTHLVAS